MVLTLAWWLRQRRHSAASTTERTIRLAQLSDSLWLLNADLFPEGEVTRAGGRLTIRRFIRYS